MKSIKVPLSTTGIESAFLATPLFRNNVESWVQLPDNQHGRNMATIFEGMANVEFGDELPTLDEAIFRYGDYGKLAVAKLEHVSKMYVDCFGMEHDNYIPFMRFSQGDIEKAYKQLSKFNKPICINAAAGRYWMDKNIENHQLMMGEDKWKFIIDLLKADGHDVLFFTSSRCHFDLPNTIPMLDFPIREMCAMFKVGGFYIGIESGMFHGAVAAGAMCFQLIPYLDQPKKFYWKNFVYTEDMWKYEKKRVLTNTFDQLDVVTHNVRTLYSYYR